MIGSAYCFRQALGNVCACVFIYTVMLTATVNYDML